ncbi:uncharacterized protein [Dendrobates tinctorius]|uniref:uncharacterized protein n=1 Tax=Dendrobates tinctorius TaxID=92724 RepID=UPI003CCA565E
MEYTVKLCKRCPSSRAGRATKLRGLITLTQESLSIKYLHTNITDFVAIYFLLVFYSVTIFVAKEKGKVTKHILAGNPTVSSGSTVTALSIVLLHCAAVTVVLDGTVGFRARCILAGNPTVSSGSTVTALSIVLLHCAAVTVVLDGTVVFRARCILAGNPTVSSGSTVTALSIVLLHCAAVTVVLDGTVGFRARCILAGNPTVSSGSTVTALSIVLLYCAAVTVVLDGTVFFLTTVDKVRTRWRSIKDRFNSDVRAEGQVRSGSASRTRTRYRHYHALQFLRPVLATRSTWSSTLQPGPGAVLPRTSSDPSQPSDSQEAPCRSATHTAGDQEAGPSGVPLSQVSATGYAGTPRQRQRALDRNVLPEFMHLSEAFNSSLKSLSDRVESGFALMERGFNHFEHRFNSVEQRLDRLEADLNRPAHHFFSKIEKGMAEHLSPEQQLNVLQACNNAFLQAMQHNRYGQQSVVSFPPVPPLTRFTSLPTCAAYHCTDTSIQSQDTHRYTTTSLSAAGHFTDTTMLNPLWKRGDSLISNLQTFLEVFCKVFDEPGQVYPAASSLHRLHQDNLILCQNTICFRTPSAKFAWNNEALVPAFWEGLSKGRECHDIPISLVDLVCLVTWNDIRFPERSKDLTHERRAMRLAPTFQRPIILQSSATTSSSESMQID